MGYSCPRDYFQNVQQIDYSTSFTKMLSTASYVFKAERPFLPLAILDPLTFEVDFTNSKNFALLYNAILNDCLEASQNYVDNLPLSNPQYMSGEWGFYLAGVRGINNDQLRLDRYTQQANLLFQFWNNFVVGVDYAADLQKLDSLMTILKNQTDKRYWIAPGTYHVEGGNASNDIADAILAANPTWPNVTILILELNSIG